LEKKSLCRYIPHKGIHEKVQVTVDYYGQGRDNSEILNQAQEVENDITRVFEVLDKIKELHCE
jgi:methyl-accepting chemotaxis protein